MVGRQLAIVCRSDMKQKPHLQFSGGSRVARVADAEWAQASYNPVPATMRLCLVKVDDVWVTCEDGPWDIAYRLVLQGGRLVIGELRVYPREERDGVYVLPPWDNARDLKGVHAPAPPGGLTATVVHRITPGTDVHVGRQIVKLLRGRVSPLWKRLMAMGVDTPQAPLPATAHRMGGPAGKGRTYYENIARIYMNAPVHPVQAVVKALRISPGRARDAIHRARHRHHVLPLTSRGKVKACVADIAALQRIATDSQTRGRKVPQVKDTPTKKARQTPGRERRA